MKMFCSEEGVRRKKIDFILGNKKSLQSIDIQGNARGGAKNLTLHLLKDENDHVEVHELLGFSSNNLISKLNEAHAIRKAT